MMNIKCYPGRSVVSMFPVRRALRFFGLCACMAFQSMALGAEIFEEDLLFKASFDGTAAAEKGVAREPVEACGIEYIPGRFGKAVVIGEGQKRSLAYATAGNLDPVEGTCLFWANFLDWQPKENSPAQVLFFSTADEKNFSSWVGFGQDIWAFTALGCDSHGTALRSESGALTEAFTRAWAKNNEWHQLGFSWKAGEIHMFLDGQEVACNRTQNTPPYLFGTRWFLGNRLGYKMLCHEVGQGKTGIDDLRIYRRALEKEEVTLLFQRTGDDKTGSDVLLLLNDYIISERCAARVFVRAIPDYAARVHSATLAIKARDGTVACREALPSFLRGEAQAWISTRTLSTGVYQAVCEVLDKDRRVIAATTREYVKYPRPEWVDNTIGKEETVPWPFTPLEKQGNTVRCWGREYRYGESLLPDQIVSQGKALLRDPIVLEIADEKGAWNALRSAESTVAETKPNLIRWTRTAKSANARIACEQEFDYDGSVWVTLRTQTTNGAPSPALRLRVPFRPEAVSTFHNISWHDGDSVDGMLKGQPARTFPFSPAFWFGTPDAGLQWFADSTRNWVFADGALANPPDFATIQPLEKTNTRGQAFPIRVARAGRDASGAEGLDFTVTLAALPTPRTGEIVYRFGFQALPYKPLPENAYFWRHIYHHKFSHGKPDDTRIRRMGIQDLYEFSGLLVNPTYYCARSEVTPPRIDTPKERETIESIGKLAQTTGIPLMLYFSAKVAVLDRPEEQRCLPEWNTENTRMCFAGSWTDYLLFRLKQMVDQCGFQGIYMDNTCFFPCYNPTHECSWIDERGVRQGGFCFRAEHEFRKRLYMMLYQKWGKNLVVEENSSGYRIAPLNAFSTVLLDGESIQCMNAKGEFSPRIVQLLQTMSSPRLWSSPVIWFGHALYAREDPKHPERFTWGSEKMPFEMFAGLLRLHGINSDYCSGQHYGQIFRLYEAEDRFDFRRNVRFIPYWEAAGMVRSSHPESVKVSVYVRPERVMLFVVNTSKDDLTETLTIDRKALGIRPANQDWPAEDPYAAEQYILRQDDTITFPMRGKSFRPLIIER